MLRKGTVDKRQRELVHTDSSAFRVHGINRRMSVSYRRGEIICKLYPDMLLVDKEHLNNEKTDRFKMNKKLK